MFLLLTEVLKSIWNPVTQKKIGVSPSTSSREVLVVEEHLACPLAVGYSKSADRVRPTTTQKSSLTVWR
jgi:hypothetical protein